VKITDLFKYNPAGRYEHWSQVIRTCSKPFPFTGSNDWSCLNDWGAIFVLVGPGIDAAGPALIIAFLLNGVITLFTALTYAELGSALPATGGGYKWVREGLPRPNSYLSGWMAWFAHTIAGSLYAVAFGTFLGHLLKSAEIIDDAFGFPLEKLFAVIAIAIFTFINVRGSSHTGKVGSAITFTQLLIIGVLIIAALVAMSFKILTGRKTFETFFLTALWVWCLQWV